MKRTFAAFIATLCICAYLPAQEPELLLDNPPEITEDLDVIDFTGDGQAAAEGIHGEKTKWLSGVTAGYFHSAADWVQISGGLESGCRENLRSRPGFTVGFAASLPFGQVWSFDTGLNVSMWGFGYSSPGVDMRCERYMAEIPLLITFFESDAYVPVVLQAGLLTGVLIGGDIKISGDAGYGEWPGRKAWDSFSKLSLGLVLGIGYWNFTFQFIQNFTGIWNTDMTYAWEQFTGNTLTQQRSRAYSITYTYWF